MSHHGKARKKPIPSNNAKLKGRTAAIRPRDVSPTRPDQPIDARTEADRPISAGAGRKRGDRRDMQPDPGTRADRQNRGLRQDRDPTSVAGRRQNKSEGG